MRGFQGIEPGTGDGEGTREHRTHPTDQAHQVRTQGPGARRRSHTSGQL